MARTLARAESTFDAIERLADEGLPAQEFLEEVGPRIDRVVPSDGYFMAATDPNTTLSIGSGVVHDLPADMCQPTWDYEFLVPDYLKFVDIAAGDSSVADLHEATGGRPERSPRWREFGAATGFHAELRAAFTIGEAAWGVGQFNRLGDSPRYSEEEKAWLERVAPVVAGALRKGLVSQPASSPADRGPGIVVLDPEGRPVSATCEAEAWLDEVGWPSVGRTSDEIPLPYEATAYAAQVRAVAPHECGKVPRARVRTRSGVWLLMHAAPLRGTEQVALVIEPAKASDVAPLIVEAYGLTQRELDVTRAIARGLGTAEIAARLFLSQHTVRDHVKAVFEKVGVSSRGELVARVFAEHYSKDVTSV